MNRTSTLSGSSARLSLICPRGAPSNVEGRRAPVVALAVCLQRTRRTHGVQVPTCITLQARVSVEARRNPVLNAHATAERPAPAAERPAHQISESRADESHQYIERLICTALADLPARCPAQRRGAPRAGRRPRRMPANALVALTMFRCRRASRCKLVSVWRHVVIRS